MPNFSASIYINDIQLSKVGLFQKQVSALVSEVNISQHKAYKSSVNIIKGRELGAKLLIDGLYQAYQYNTDASLIVPLSQRSYHATQSNKINLVSYGVMKSLVASIVGMGWATLSKGQIINAQPIPSKLKPAGDLLEAFKSVGNVWQEHKVNYQKEVIVLKNYDPVTKKKFILKTPDTREVRRMRTSIRRINKFLDQHAICLHLSNERLEKGFSKPINFSNVRLHRVFSRSSLKLGGRFYGGWWQNIDSQYRPYITINGLATVEIDYSEIHPRLLYEGKSIPSGDLYDIGIRVKNIPYNKDIEPYKSQRRVIKKYLNALINDETGYFKLSKGEIKILGHTAAEIHKKLVQRHPHIETYLGQGKGLELQYIDSQIAEQVMLTMLDKGILCLPIHDSFICPRHQGKELIKAMQTAYKKFVKGSLELKPPEPYKSDFLLPFLPDGTIDRKILFEIHRGSLHNKYVQGRWSHKQ
jgi:hypothetical protein